MLRNIGTNPFIILIMQELINTPENPFSLGEVSIIQLVVLPFALSFIKYILEKIDDFFNN